MSDAPLTPIIIQYRIKLLRNDVQENFIHGYIFINEVLLTGFDLIKVSAEQGVIIHKIQSRPSYDSLSLVALTNGKYNGQLKCDAPVTTTLASKLKACFKSVPSYLETHDFAVN